MSSRSIFAICPGAVFLSVFLVPLPSARHLLWTFALWSIFLVSLVAFVPFAANMAGVLACMYFGYLPGKRGARKNLLSFVRPEGDYTLIRNADSPEDFLRELNRIHEALADPEEHVGVSPPCR